jgi:non-canonical purine NTP pyrophosphatase (RdgB/HAM1 family)
MMEILIATGNANKVREIQALLNRPVRQISLDLPELQAIEVEEVIRHKARAAYQATGQPVLVEDTGLFIHAWGGLPGALIRWFDVTVGNAGICRMLDGFADRSALARTCLGLCDGQRELVFTGEIEGSIAAEPRGTGGFGWDAIFIPTGWDKTFGEGQPAEKAAISMRRKAVDRLIEFLEREPGLFS